MILICYYYCGYKDTHTWIFVTVLLKLQKILQSLSSEGGLAQCLHGELCATQKLRVVQSIGSENRVPGFESQLCHILAG